MFNIAPFITMIVAMLRGADRFAKDFQLWDLNIGVLFVTRRFLLMVVSILMMAGWSSNNKLFADGCYAGGAQIVSYELSAGLSVAAIIV